MNSGAILRHVWPLLVSVTVKSLFVLALAALTAMILRRASAAARHLVWRLALIGLLLLPVLSLVPSSWQVPVWTQTAAAPVPSPVPPSPVQALPPTSPVLPSPAALPVSETNDHPVSPATQSHLPLPWPVWASGLWLLGVLLVLLPYGVGLAGIRRLARSSHPVPDGPLITLTTSLAADMGCRRSVCLLLGDTTTPMTWGWRRPMILLPLDAEEWPTDRLRAVLLHELAHIARGDWPAQMAAHFACACYWFHPGVWLAARQARLESERACDDRVLLAGIPPADYARHLLDVARSLRDTPLPAVLPMAQTSQVEGRLRAVLGRRQRGEVTLWGVLVAAGATLLIVGGLTAHRLASRPHATVQLVSSPTATLSLHTPAVQNGYDLLAVQRGDGMDNSLTVNSPQGPVPEFAGGTGGMYQSSSEGTVLWIRPPVLSHISTLALLHRYQISVRTSTGTTFQLPYTLAEGGTPPAGDMPQILCVSLPVGYPNTYRFMDVTISDRSGSSATWRLTNLPHMRHILNHPRFQTQARLHGFSLRAAAWRFHNPDSESLFSNGVLAGLQIVSVPKHLAEHWELDASDPVMEWAPQSSFPGASIISSRVTSVSSPRDGWMTPVWQTPYASDIHFVSVNASLCQYATYDEPVTFHNVTLRQDRKEADLTECVVTATQTVTTPSGITITLPRQPVSEATSDMAGMISCEFSFAGGNHPLHLPKSPLYRRFHRPVLVQVTVPSPDKVGSIGMAGQLHTLDFSLPKPYPTHLANFTLIVHQRVNLQTLPMRFVVPVRNKPPDFTGH